MNTSIKPTSLLAALTLAGALVPAAAHADQYAIQVSATFDMDNILTFGSPPADNIWGVPASSGDYTVTTSFSIDTNGAVIVAAGTYDINDAQRQYDWYGIGIGQISGFSVQFGTKAWSVSNLEPVILSTFDGVGAFLSSDSAPMWFSPQAGIIAFDAWDLDASSYVNAFTYSQAEGGTGYGPTQAHVSDQNASVQGLITTSIQAVPEADTWVMLLAGLSLVGWAARRRG